MIDNDLRDLMPAERRLPLHRKQQLKERLMHEIETEGTPARRRPRVRRTTAGLVAAAVLATSGAAAAAIRFGGPDPKQAAQVIENNAEAAKVHLEGWRPALRSERVACIGPDSRKLTDPRQSGSSSASEFPLEDNLTAELLIEECVSGNDWARSQGGFDKNLATACVRDAPRHASPGRGAAPPPGDFLLAVVALEGLDCAETGDGVRPIRDDDLARLNQMRALEVAVLAIPEECPGFEEALDWARARVDEHGAHLRVRGSAEGPLPAGAGRRGDGCFRGMTYWEWGEVIVSQFSAPGGPGTTPPEFGAREESTSTTARPTGSDGFKGD